MRVRDLTTACCLAALLLCLAGLAWAGPVPKEEIFQMGPLKPLDSQVKVRVGQMAPDFSLPSLAGGRVNLSQYRGRQNVVLSFVPAAWTSVCSEQWPGYNLAKEEFTSRDTVILGITADNLPTLYAWTQAMGGVWFPVLSDFWPHGQVATLYGILRGDGTTERALFLIDKQGVLRYIDVHDINQRPDLGALVEHMDKLK